MLCKANGWVQPGVRPPLNWDASNLTPWQVFQCMYNAINRTIEPELLAACRRYGLDIVVHDPLPAVFSPEDIQHSARAPFPRKVGIPTSTGRLWPCTASVT